MPGPGLVDVDQVGPPVGIADAQEQEAPQAGGAGIWTPREMETFVTAVETEGVGNWKGILERHNLPGRTGNGLRRKWLALKKTIAKPRSLGAKYTGGLNQKLAQRIKKVIGLPMSLMAEGGDGDQ
jgi:hypothetical protein